MNLKKKKRKKIFVSLLLFLNKIKIIYQLIKLISFVAIFISIFYKYLYPIMLYDFEDGNIYFNDASGGTGLSNPTNFTFPRPVQKGNRSQGWNLALKPTFNDPYVGEWPSPSLNLSPYTGLIAFMYIPADANISDSTPLTAQLYVQSGNGWTWTSGPWNNLVKGYWNKIFYPFSSAPPSNPADIRGVGFKLSGAATSSGNIKFYLDSYQTMDNTAPDQVINLTVSNPGTGGKLILQWNAVTNSDLDYYEIYQKTPSGTSNIIAYVRTNYYEDYGCWNNTNYYYRVRAVDVSTNKGIFSSAANNSATGIMPQVTYPWKGIQYVSWWRGEYTNAQSKVSLTNIKKTGANTVGIIVTWYMTSGTANSLYSNVNKTHSDGEIIALINHIHSMGMKVMLKPHVDCDDGTFRGNINPANKHAWFASYSNMIIKYARIATNTKVELFCVGTELHSMTTNNAVNVSHWNNIINRIATFYTNKLLYAAGWDMYKKMIVWDNSNIDYIGIDAYFPLTDEREPYLSKIYYSWERYNGTNAPGKPKLRPYDTMIQWFNEIKNFQAAKGKPVIFAEIGYRSIDYAAARPYEWGTSGTYNGNNQKNCYEAFFRKFYNQDWFQGSFFWNWLTSPTAGGSGDLDYTPQNKPAENVLKAWYGAGNEPPNKPPKPRGPKIGYVNKIYSYTNSTTDPNGDRIYYTFDWGDGTQTNSSRVPSGTQVSFPHKWTNAGWYYVRTKAMDTNGATGPWSDPLRVDIFNLYDLSKYHFERDKMGWTNTTTSGDKAITNVTQTSFPTRFGFGALKLDARLIGGNADYSKGEAKVDVVDYPAAGETNTPPYNLQNVPVSIWVYVPTGGAGPSSTPNGLQIFFKDSTWKNWYGPWINITNENKWFRLEVTLGVTTPSYVDAGFDMTKIRMIGIKYAAGSGSTAVYNGPIYIDAVNWKIGANSSPNTPPKCTGPTNIINNQTYYYTNAGASDPNGDMVAYIFDWGDGTESVTKFSNSGWSPIMPHSWNYAGIYPVKVMAIDRWGAISGWSPILNVYIQDYSDPSKYHFEPNKQGWTNTVSSGNAGVTNTVRDNTRSRFGNACLKIDYKINSTNPNGEAWVDMTINKPTGEPNNPPLDFTNVPVNLWVYTPKSAIGDPSRPNGYQIFFKDNSWRGWYGPWINVTDGTNKWMRLEVTIGQTSPSYVDAGFNPHQIRVVGLKFARGGGSSWSGNGSIWLDSVNWKIGANSPPNVPSTPSGPTTNNWNSPANYSTSTTDPDGDIVAYIFDWGDGTETVTRFTNSGATVTATHKWILCGTHNIKVRAVDKYGAISDWSSSKTIYIPIEDPSRYHFETGKQGWQNQQGAGNFNACINVAWSTNFVKKGHLSLRMDMHIIPGNSTYDNGEAFVDMANTPPDPQGSEFVPIALSNVKVTNWVYCPTGAIGDPSKPNGIQIFFKDINWKSWYGPWNNVVENQWVKYTNIIGITTPGYVDSGFNGNLIRAIGVKMGGGGGSTKTYDGPIYIDAIYWEIPFNLKSSIPTNYAINVSLSQVILLTFNASVKTNTVNINNVYIIDSDLKKVNASYNVINTNIYITPSSTLQPNEFYTIIITTNLQATDGRKIKRELKRYFRTTKGNTTPHYYNTINLADGTTNGWISTNKISYDGTKYEKSASETSPPNAAWKPQKLWVTWDSNNLYICVINSNFKLSDAEWYDYIALDTTRDDKGATNIPPYGGARTFVNYRKPEYLIIADHDDGGAPAGADYKQDWNSIDFVLMTNFNGSGWGIKTSLKITNVYVDFQRSGTTDGDNFIEIKIPWTNFRTNSTSGRCIPNRISISVYRRNVDNNLDAYCPYLSTGSTNWFTFDPDNDDDDIPDKILPPPAGPQIVISKQITNISLSGNSVSSIPGSTISYLIKCSNAGATSASNICIYDRIDQTYVIYKSNSVSSTSGWTNQWSTNLNPNQSYNSLDYKNSEPSPQNVKWIRWKKGTPLSPGEKATFGFKVIIK